VPVSEFTVREVKVDNGGLTVRLEIPPAPPGPKPAVIAFFGEAALLRDAGMIAVSYADWRVPKREPPPAADNGVGKWVLLSPSAGVLGQEYFRVIGRNAREIIPKVIDYLVSDPDVDPTRISITGASTNGFAVLEALAVDKRLTAAVAGAACGDYHQFLQFSSMGLEGAPLKLDAAYDRWLRDQEPINHPDAMVHGALLMLNQEADVLIPIGCAEATARVFQKAYERAGVPERFRFVRTPDGGHGIGDPERREALAWLSRWLHVAPAP
jgi:hypothetical protein